MNAAEVSGTFAAQCRRSADDPEAATAVVMVGAQHLVLVAETRVWRFPLHRPDCARLEEMAERLRRAAACDLDVPRVVGVVAGPPGHGHLVLDRIDGTPLLTAVAAGQDVELAVMAALAGLRRTHASQWPFPQLDWVDMWLNFAATARRYRGDLPAEHSRRLIDAADRAAAVARDSPIRIVHGDLASDNIMVAPNGTLAGILDWDGAVVGDPAIDTAAVLHVVGEQTTERLTRQHAWLRHDLRRWDVYRETWELQNLLWKLGLTPPLWAGTAR